MNIQYLKDRIFELRDEMPESRVFVAYNNLTQGGLSRAFEYMVNDCDDENNLTEILMELQSEIIKIDKKKISVLENSI